MEKPILGFSILQYLLILFFISFSTIYSYASEKMYAPLTKSSAQIDKPLEQAKAHASEGRYKEALHLLHPFSEKPMMYPEEASDYISILVWDGRHEEAIRMFENLPSSFPKRPYLIRNIAKAYYEKKDFSEAASLYLLSVTKDPLDKEAQKGLVFSLIENGSFENASNYLEQFLKDSPDSIQLHLAKARLMLFQEKYAEALMIYRLIAQEEDVDSEQIYRMRDNLIHSLPSAMRHDMIIQLSRATQKDKKIFPDYILSLIVNGKYEAAIDVFETETLPIDNYNNNLLCWIAWAYFKTKNIEKAKYHYNLVLEKRPDFARAHIGMSYIFSTEGNGEKALEKLDELLLAEPDNIDIMFARAFAYEQMRMFWLAITVYDRILEIVPENTAALRLKIQNLSDLGARSVALNDAEREFPDDLKLQATIKSDMAVDRINWLEPKVSKEILFTLIDDKNNLRARFDYLIAQAENYDMEGAVEDYEQLIEDNIALPYWILENAAKAYLYLEKPHKALDLYNKALEMHPASLEGRKGKFYTLQELRKWKDAEEVLDSIDDELPFVFSENRRVRPNWLKLEIAIDRGWFITYQEKYREAEEHFWNMRVKAPANMGIRTGLAHVYLWRGWPRKALREFRIIETIDPENKKALIGQSVALNELAFKEEARELSERLLSKHPKDKHVLQLERMFKVDQMAELFVDFVYTTDDEDFEDIRFEATLRKPVTLFSSVYGYFLWQESSDDEQTRRFRRAGLGVTHIFNSSWNINQRFTVDYDTGDDFGSYTLVNFTPNDYWKFGLSYDSFSTDIPLRARVFGIEADKLEAGITYRESEWRSYHLLLTHMKFSDSNRRQQALLTYEQGLLVKSDWRMRIFLELYASKNSRDDAPYFNPEHDYSISATHMTQQTLWNIYDRVFVHKLFLSFGTYKQSGYSHKPIGSIKYQQEHDFSDTQALVWGVSATRQVYDGDPVHEYSFYLTYRGRF